MKVRKRTLLLAFPIAAMFAFGLLWYWIARTDHFQNFARATLESKIREASGLDCSIKSVKFDIFRGNFLISEAALSSREKPSPQIKINVHEVRAALSVSSFLHSRVRLSGLTILRPVVEIATSDSSSPWNPDDLLQALKLSFRLEAANVVIEDGFLRANDISEPFHVALEDLDCTIGYEKKAPSYRLSLKYRKSRMKLGERDIVHDLDLQGNISTDGIAIERYRFVHDGTVLSGSGSMANWRAPVFSLRANGNLDARDLRYTSDSLYEGKGNIAVNAALTSDKEGVRSTGQFNAGPGQYRKMRHEGIVGSFEIGHDVLYLKNVVGRVAKGSFKANGEIQLRSENKAQNQIRIETSDFPAIDSGRLLKLPLIHFENPVDSKIQLTWFNDKPLRADCDLDIKPLDLAPTDPRKSLRMGGKAKFVYVEGKGIDVSSADLHSSDTSLKGSGGKNDSFHIEVSTRNLFEPIKLIAGFAPVVADIVTKNPDMTNIAGNFQFDGELQINNGSDIRYRGGISAQQARWRSYRMDYLNSQAQFISPRIEFGSLQVRSGSQSADGSLSLQFDDDGQVSNFDFAGEVKNASMASFKEMGLFDVDVAGIVSGNGALAYRDGVWRGQGRIAIENGVYKGEPFDSLRVQARLDENIIHLDKAEAARGKASLSAEGEVNIGSRRLHLKTSLRGLPLEDVPAIQKKKVNVRGIASASGAVSGSFDDPSFSGDFKLAGLRYESLEIGDGVGQIKLEQGKVHVGARIQSDLGKLEITADIASGSKLPGKATLQFENLNIRKIVPAKELHYFDGFNANIKGMIEAEGSFDDLASLNFKGEVDGAHFKVRDYELSNSGRIQFSADSKKVRIENARFIGAGTDLVLSGAVPFDGNPSLDLLLSGRLNLKTLEGIEPNYSLSGSANLDIRASGSKNNPQIIGRASFEDSGVDIPDSAFKFSGMKGDVVFSRNMVRFENFRGNAASGTVQVSGIVEHSNAVLRAMNVNISIRNARLQFPKDFRSVVNADLMLNGSRDAQMLSGEINVTRMEYLRRFNLLEQLASRSSSAAGPLSTESYLRGLRFNLDIRSDNGLWIDNELTRLSGSMRLKLLGTPAYPYLTGRVEAVDGTIFFRGSRFQISHATADFVDRNRINPVLEIRAEADVKTYRLILDAMGDLDHLNLNVSSDPPMSTVDIISLLTTGKTETGIETDQYKSKMTGVSAASVLSENLTGVIGRRVQRILGLESFRVDPFLAGAENDPTARITISERLSKDLVVTFSRNLTTYQEQIVVIEYDVGKNLSMVATRDEKGKYGLDFRFRHRMK